MSTPASFASWARPTTTLLSRAFTVSRRTVSSAFRSKPPKPTRAYATQSSPPPPSNLKAVPFRLSQSEAETIFRNHHEGWLTSARSMKGLKCERMLLPFWVVRANMKISLESAQLGFHYWYDFHRKEHKRVRKVRWEHRDFGRHPVSSARLDGTELYSQIYASYRFKKEYVDGVRGAEVWSEAKPFREAQLPENVVADPFQMNSRVAWDRVIAAFQVQEELRLEGALKSETSCDEVRGLRLSIEATPVEGKKVLALPVFVSTYVFTATYRGTTFRTFVNGTSGAIGGQRIPAPERVGLLVGGAASLVAVLTGAFSSAGFFLLWFAVPFTIAMFAARFWPLIWAAIYEARRRGAEALEAEANSTPGGGPRAGRHYGPGEYQQEQQRQQQQQQQRGQQDEFGSWWEELQQRAKRGQDQYQQQQQQSRQRTSSSSSSSRSTSPMGAPRDPKGYYAALGLPTTATTQEIQAAFRGKALVVHPDRVAPERKAEATGKMQVLTEAYSVLRDPKKRKTYDLLGR